MRVAVVEFAGRGGLIHYAFQLCRALAAAGAQVTLVTDRHYELEGLEHPFRLETLFRLWDPKPPGDVSPTRGAALLRRLRRGWRAVQYYREWVRLAGYLRRTRPDLVQLGDLRFPSDLAGLVLLRLLGLRLTEVCHNALPLNERGPGGAGRLLRILYRAIYRQFELVLVHYETNRRQLVRTFGLPPERVGSIVHGNLALLEELGDAGPDARALSKELGIGPDMRPVLFLGTFSAYKGIDLLLAAFPRVLRDEPRAFLLLVGFPAPGFDLGAHQALVGRFGLEERARFIARYVESPAVAGWMSLAEVVVFPYRFVYQSGALQMAMTFGVPVVATAVGAIPEVVSDGDTGLLVPPEDPDALAAAILRILASPELGRGLGRRAREQSRTRFAWEGVAASVMASYRRVLSGLAGERKDGTC